MTTITFLTVLKTNLDTLETYNIHHYKHHSEDPQSSSYKCTHQYLDHRYLEQYPLHHSYKLNNQNNKVNNASMCKMYHLPTIIPT